MAKKKQPVGIPLREIIAHQRAWSRKTFGPGDRTKGVAEHIMKELVEIRESGGKDVMEWVDLITLALDGAWRAGHSPSKIESAIIKKRKINEKRNWPDWRTAPKDKAIEHVRS